MKSGWIVGLGEVLWDVFRDGPRFGGAPANFACHARALGAEVTMVSAIGPDSDPLSGQAIAQLHERGVDTQAMQNNAHETGRVIVDVDSHGKPTYTFSEHPAWDFIEWTDAVAKVAHQARAVCFGTLAQRASTSRHTVQRFLREAPAETLKVFDVNLRADFWSDDCIADSLAHADILKLNNDELPIVAKAVGISMQAENASDELRVLGELQQCFGLQVVALTRGSEGATLLTKDTVDHTPSPTTVVKDTVGAGDAYTAAMIIGLIKGWSLPKINQQAVRVAAYVCSQSGATPDLPSDITHSFTES